MGAQPFGLDNKVAIVTGASRGIGEAIARTLAAAGAKVVLASRKQDGLDTVAKGIEDAGGQAFARACHTGRVEECEALVAAAVEKFGQVDVLVNNAATNPYFGPLLDTEWAAWDKTFDVNVKGYFAMTRAVAQHVMARGAKGSIVNVASVLGTMAAPMQGVYGMTKAAVLSMTKTLSAELGPNGIRINALAPGLIDTKFASALTSNEVILQHVLSRTSLGRVGQPVDVAGAALFLASDAAAYVNGATLFIDGGWTAG